MSLNRFVELFIAWLAGIHKTQVKTLAVLVFGLLRSPRLGVASLGRALPGPTAEKHRIKRVDRFLGNRRLRVGRCARPLARAMAGTRKRLFIAIDWTDLHDGAHQALVAGVVTRGRALPVWWQVMAKEQLTANQNRFEERFVAKLRELLPPKCEVIILADRGFGRVSFLQKLEALGFKYVIRTQGNVWVEGEGYTGVLGKLKVGPGTQWDLGLVRYQKEVGWPATAGGALQAGTERTLVAGHQHHRGTSGAHRRLVCPADGSRGIFPGLKERAGWFSAAGTGFEFGAAVQPAFSPDSVRLLLTDRSGGLGRKTATAPAADGEHGAKTDPGALAGGVLHFPFLVKRLAGPMPLGIPYLARNSLQWDVGLKVGIPEGAAP